MRNIKKFETALENRRKELDQRLHGIEDRLDQPADDDVEERATEREEDEVLERLGLSGQMELDLINQALQRVKDGTYGICVTCGDEISDERLNVVPHATQCRDCANSK